MHRARVFILTHRVVFRYQLSSVTAQDRAQLCANKPYPRGSVRRHHLWYILLMFNHLYLRFWKPEMHHLKGHCSITCGVVKYCVPDFRWFQNSNTSYLQNLVKGSRQPTGCFVYFLAEQTKLRLNFWKERRWSNFLKGMYPENFDTLWYFQLFGWSKMVHGFFTPNLDVKPLPRPECLHRGSSHPGGAGRTTVDPETSSSVTTGDSVAMGLMAGRNWRPKTTTIPFDNIITTYSNMIWLKTHEMTVS